MTLCHTSLTTWQASCLVSPIPTRLAHRPTANNTVTWDVDNLLRALWCPTRRHAAAAADAVAMASWYVVTNGDDDDNRAVNLSCLGPMTSRWATLRSWSSRSGLWILEIARDHAKQLTAQYDDSWPSRSFQAVRRHSYCRPRSVVAHRPIIARWCAIHLYIFYGPDAEGLCIGITSIRPCTIDSEFVANNNNKKKMPKISSSSCSSCHQINWSTPMVMWCSIGNDDRWIPFPELISFIICIRLPSTIPCQLPLKLSVHQATKHLLFSGFGTACHCHGFTPLQYVPCPHRHLGPA